MSDFIHNVVAGIGKPIAGNPTGFMFEQAFAAAGLDDWRYELFEVEADQLAAAIAGMRAFGFVGMNTTIPLKVLVSELLDETSEAATMIGAVNTICRDGEKYFGENTDGKGFLRSLADAGFDPRGTSALILGAGGAARAIATELALAGAGSITVAARRTQQAQAIVEIIAVHTAADAKPVHWLPGLVIPAETQLVVQATPMGLYPDTSRPDVDYDSVTSSMTVADVVFNPPETGFLKEAAAREAVTLDGLGMLVHQGEIAFELWTGRNAPHGVMRAALGSAFGASGRTS